MHLDAMYAARQRLAPYLQPTPLETAPMLGDSVWLKLENANKTHSFKVRGALNAMLMLDDAARARGIVAASSGNHALGVAYAAHLLGLNARIVMPTNAARRKIAGVKRYGAEAILFGERYEECEAEGRRLERDEGLTYVSAYNDPNIVAGAGTIGLEIVEQCPQVERVLVPVSGGGLLSGVAVALKSLKPSVEVIGVDASAGPEMYNLIYGTQHVGTHHTLADALPGDVEAGSITIDLVRRFVDRLVLVSEESIADAMRYMIDVQGWLAEGGGVVGVAALRGGVIASDRPTVVVVSGGNVDGETVRAILRNE